MAFNSQPRERAASFNLMINPLRTSENIVTWDYKFKREGNWSIGKSRKQVIQDVGTKFADKVFTQEAGKVFSVTEKENVLQVEKKNNGSVESSGDGQGKPSQEQLNSVYEVLRVDVRIFLYKLLGNNGKAKING